MRSRCNDIEVAWHEAGRGDPLILIHGLADDHRAWRRAVPDLMLHHRLLMYDLRGHGETSLGAADGTLRQLGDDLVTLLDAIEVERADIAGFSLGGTIAMRVAIDHPDRARGIALVATSSRVGHSAAGWYRERAEMVERNDPHLRDTLDKDTADVYAESPSELEGGLLIRRQSTEDPRGYGNACAAMAGLHAKTLHPEPPRLNAPPLIVAFPLPRRSPPQAAEGIASGLRGSKLEGMRGAGHPIPVGKTRELASSINS